MGEKVGVPRKDDGREGRRDREGGRERGGGREKGGGREMEVRLLRVI